MQFVWAFALLVASYAITQLTARKPQAPKPATFDDFDFPQSAEGTPQPVVFGDVWLGAWLVLYYGNYGVEPIRGRSGKK